MPSHALNYLDYTDFHLLLFSTIEEQYNYDPTDPLPDYRKENSQELIKILTFVKHDSFYPTLEAKAAYLLTSIIKNHVYSNGNKRLALITMLFFLFINEYLLATKTGELKNLCLFIADKEQNNNMGFDKLKAYAETFIRDRLEKHTVNVSNQN